MLSKEQFKYIIFAMGLGLVIYYLGGVNRKKHLTPARNGHQGAVIYKSGFKEYKKGFVSARQVFKNPKAYTNTLKVQGLVGPVFPEDSIFFISDIGCGNSCSSRGNKGAGSETCKSGKAGCSESLLAIKLSEVIGKMPSSGDVVAVFGRVGAGRGGKLVVLARKIRKLGTIGKKGKSCCQSKAGVKKGVKQSVYSVKAIAANPYSFTGIITIKGNVKGVYPKKSMFGLADCQTKQHESGCGGALIPVKYSEVSVPSDNQCVAVTGVIKSDKSGKLFLESSQIKRLDSDKCQPSPQRV